MRRMYSKPQLLEAVEQESKLNGIKVFEDIKDKDGHARFIDITFTPETVEGVNFTYSKASLSGTHLLIVLAGTIEENTAVPFTNFAYIPLEQWLLDKLYPQYTDVLDTKNIYLYAQDASQQSMMSYLTKQSNRLAIIVSGVTADKDRNFRIAFDLLIDNE